MNIRTELSNKLQFDYSTFFLMNICSYLIIRTYISLSLMPLNVTDTIYTNYDLNVL